MPRAPLSVDGDRMPIGSIEGEAFLPPATVEVEGVEDEAWITS